MNKKERSQIIKAIELIHDKDDYWGGMEILMGLIGAKSAVIEALKNAIAVPITEIKQNPSKFGRKRSGR
ncbi:unnamed protein product [marine sediment metagenome]|uniref:Uncharacterized protein n=1 Tax=marine sediment metagenome TaxID=412755 RepID=X0VA40_9ZZZZ